MPTWIVLRHGPQHNSGPARGPAVVGSVTADTELDARFAAHAWWMCHPEDRLDMVARDTASESDRSAADACSHLDLAREAARMEDIFEDRLRL